MKKIVPILMVVLMIGLAAYRIVLGYDETILVEPIENEYVGINTADDIIRNISFKDMSSTHWAREPITRVGALGALKGFAGNFEPGRNVTKAEALAVMIRLLGRETDAINRGVQLEGGSTQVSPEFWQIGYISLARDLGFITERDYQDALYPKQSELTSSNFVYQSGVSREQIAAWIVHMLNTLDPTSFNKLATNTRIYSYSDYANISQDKQDAVELVTNYNIMIGTGSRFEPKRTITRAELAQLVKNIDTNYYNVIGVIKKVGYVGEIVDQTEIINDRVVTNRYFYIRNPDGKVDRIRAYTIRNNLKQLESYDIPTHRSGAIGGSSLIRKGDAIEYLINADKETLYINSNIGQEEKIVASIYSLDELADGKIRVKRENGTLYLGTLSTGIYDKASSSLLIDNVYMPLNKLPVSNKFVFTVKGNVIVSIQPIGDEVLIHELKGIVKSVDPGTKAIQIYDANKNVISKNWTMNTTVEKKEYYETTNDVGYIDEVFKEYMYDKMDASVEAIEPGDIIYLRMASDGTIDRISAATNYIVKYGRVKYIESRGIMGGTISLKYENEAEEMLDVSPEVFVVKGGRKIAFSDILIGDWVKILYNRGIIAENNIVESVKQINVSGVENEITNIYRGELLNIDQYQGQITFKNTLTYSPRGFVDYKNAKTMKLSDDAVFYSENKRISKDYMNNFLKNNGTAYIAVTENMGREEIVKITFRFSKEQVLNLDNVNFAKGNGEIRLMQTDTSVLSDAGTIVRRYGRMVDEQSIFTPDYVKIVLNGRGSAAIVDIVEEIDNSRIDLYRGRIRTVEERTGFTVTSFSRLAGMEWNYMPLEKMFTIDYNTRIYQNGTRVPYDQFIDYTETSQIDRVYTIVAQGEEALMLIDGTFPTFGVTGTIYQATGTELKLNEVVSYNKTTKSWEEISRVDKTMPITISPTAVMIKNSKIIKANELKVGDKVRAIGTENGYTVKQEGRSYVADILIVE